MTAGITIRAYGRPIPQGSKKHVGGGRLVEAARGHKAWRKAITAAAADAGRHHVTEAGPVFVRATFTVNRPTSHYRTGRNAYLLRDHAPAHPITRTSGDLDKLVRSVLDSLVDAQLLGDDSQVVDLRARKVWAGEHELALDRPGVRIDIVPFSERNAP